MTAAITTERHGRVISISSRRPPLNILDHSLIVTRLTKRALRAGQNQPFAEALEESDRIHLQELCETEDTQEGLSAFPEKAAADMEASLREFSTFPSGGPRPCPK